MLPDVTHMVPSITPGSALSITALDHITSRSLGVSRRTLQRWRKVNGINKHGVCPRHLFEPKPCRTCRANRDSWLRHIYKVRRDNQRVLNTGSVLGIMFGLAPVLYAYLEYCKCFGWRSWYTREVVSEGFSALISFCRLARNNRTEWLEYLRDNCGLTMPEQREILTDVFYLEKRLHKESSTAQNYMNNVTVGTSTHEDYIVPYYRVMQWWASIGMDSPAYEE